MGEKARHRRVVLLFDTHEAFFGEAIADPGTLLHADYLMRDEWLRSLLGHLPLEAGVVAVVAGRTRPPWASAPVAAIPDAFVDCVAGGPSGHRRRRWPTWRRPGSKTSRCGWRWRTTPSVGAG